MGSSSDLSSAVSAEFRAAFIDHTKAGEAMTFAEFMRLALYDPAVGYYRKPRVRIGYRPDADFFTSASSGRVYGELVSAACLSLLGARASESHTFIEIGAEPGASILEGVSHPFGSTKIVRTGEPLTITGPAIVFSNELFDAQEFRRFRMRAGHWVELGVALHGDKLVEVEFPVSERDEAVRFLPRDAAESYTIDAPIAAAQLASLITAGSWTGLFVACDYGKSWQELAEFCPAEPRAPIITTPNRTICWLGLATKTLPAIFVGTG